MLSWFPKVCMHCHRSNPVDNGDLRRDVLADCLVEGSKVLSSAVLEARDDRPLQWTCFTTTSSCSCFLPGCFSETRRTEHFVGRCDEESAGAFAVRRTFKCQELGACLRWRCRVYPGPTVVLKLFTVERLPRIRIWPWVLD